MACGVCNHPKRVSIEADLEAGVSIADVAAKLALSARALKTHWATHARAVPVVVAPRAPVERAPAPAVAPGVRAPAAPRARGGSTLDSIDRHLDEIEDLLEKAKDADDTAAVEKLLAERGRTHGRRARLTGEAVTEGRIVASAVFRRALGELVAAVKPFPDAARAVHEAFSRLRLEAGQ